MPAQVVENLLWLYTDVGSVVVDPEFQNLRTQTPADVALHAIKFTRPALPSTHKRFFGRYFNIEFIHLLFFTVMTYY